MSPNRITSLILTFIAGASGIASSTTAADDLVVRGQVVNEAQQPVEGATLVLVLRHGYGDDAWEVNSKSDGEGRFEFAVPPKWIEPGAFYLSRTIWCYAPGHALGTGSAYKQLDEGSDDPVRIQLPPATSMEFTVLDPTGKPLSGCRVESHHWVGDIPPQAIRDLTAALTDENGLARLPAMQPSLLRRVSVISDTYGTQRMQMDNRSGNTSATIRLQNVGEIKGRLTCVDPQAIAAVRVSVENVGSYGGLTEGAGFANTTVDGRFHIRKVAEGALEMFVGGGNVPGYRPRIPERVVVKAGETTEIEVPFEPTVTVRGSVVARDSEEPIANAFVIVRFGDRYQGENVLTGSDGKFEAQVLPGVVRQHIIIIPKPFRDWTRAAQSDASIEVPSGEASFDLPPLEIVETRVVTGTVVDASKKPAVGWIVMAEGGNRSLGGAQTDESGSFKLRVANDTTIENYQVSHPSIARQPVKTVSEDPLILQLINPEEAANVRVTTQPTPEDKREPKFTLPDANIRTLIVAREALIYEGRSMNWAELAQELGKSKDNGNGAPVVHYHLTHESYRDQARQEEAQNWAEMLSQSTPVKVQRGGGLILNWAAARYDALALGDEWPPETDKPVVGRVVSAAGEPVENAQVLFMLPNPPTWRLRSSQNVYLTDGQERHAIDHIVTYTDAKGEFRFDFPAANSNVIALAPQGFAIATASEQMEDIKLASWARITARLPRDEQGRAQSISITIPAHPEGGGAITQISLSSGHLDKPATDLEILAVPAGHRMMVSRTVWKEDANGSQMGRGDGNSFPLKLEPGTTAHLEYGPLGETE